MRQFSRYGAKKRALALILAGALGSALALPAAGAEPIGDGVAPACDEAYYATLDYYGNLLEGSVVKSYALNGASSLTDYGVYDEVVNLTDSTAAVTGEGSTVFRFTESPGHFYFEGKTARPFQNLPWTITLRYTLNGVPARAEELAGQRGVAEILIDLIPNEDAGGYARYNYTLAATALFNQDDILSLEAPGAQVQLVGNLRTVLFLALPGEERHFTIRVGSDGFSFGGMTFLMVPATLAQLDEIGKISRRKDDLEEDYRALSGSLDSLLDALSDVQGGLYASADGLDQLELARQTISNGKGVLYDGTDRLRRDLSDIAALLEPVEERIQTLSQTVTDSKAVLNELTDVTVSMKSQLDDLEDALDGLREGTGDVRYVLSSAGRLEDSLLRLRKALGETGGSGGEAPAPSGSSSGLVRQVKAVHSAYDETNRLTFLEKMLELQGESGADAKAETMENMLKTVENGLAGEEQMAAAHPAEWAAAKQLAGLFEVKSGMSFQQFCASLPGVSAGQAKQMNDLWIVYNSGSLADGALDDAELPETTIPGEEREKAHQLSAAMVHSSPADEDSPEQGDSGENGGTADPAGEDSVSGPADSGESESGGPSEPADSGEAGDIPENAGSSETGASGEGEDSGEEAASGGDSAEDDLSGEKDSGDEEQPGESGSVGGAVVDLITGGLDSASSRLDQLERQLTGTMNAIARPTAAVIGDLATLCGHLSELEDMADDADDLARALRQSSRKMQSILDSVDGLRNLLNDYEPTLQESIKNLGQLSAAATSTIRDTETLIKDAEDLMKTSGVQLDSGTRQALQGLAATLRQTARAMAATGDVRDAKTTITGIIEDTWNEYTGDVNNILLMDAEAEPVSLTDERNPSPSSIQILIRTQEIKVEEPEEPEAEAAAKEASTFWGRVARMFRDFWNMITGIFR